MPRPVARIIAGMRLRGVPRWDRQALSAGALVTAALAVFIAAVYAAVVVGLGAAFGADIPGTGLSILATTIAAFAFRPVRERIQPVVNRIVYGVRATPYEVLSNFSERVAETYATEEVLPRMARVIAGGTGASRADVWLRVGARLSRAGSWPDRADAGPMSVPVPGGEPSSLPDADRVIPVRYQGELLGAIAVAKMGEPITAAEERLLDDVVSQAGLVLRNVRLAAELETRLEEISAQAEELRASRQRIVAAQDAARRRLERDIHDGAQQYLVALAVKARMTRTLAERDPRKARATLAQLHAVCDEALETLRDLSHGIYPPVLSGRGVAAALRAQARTAELPVRVEAKGLGRHAPVVEAAVYFVCLEALQNAAKHARASRAVVRLEERAGELAFSVSDDGVGFDPSSAAPGTGRQNMADRVAVLGGALDIRSAPREGTVVTGRVPLQREGRAR